MQRPSVRSSAASSGSENRAARIEKRAAASAAKSAAAAAAAAAARGKTREALIHVVDSETRRQCPKDVCGFTILDLFLV